MSTREREKLITFWVTEEEKKLINDHIKNLGYENRSAFLRRIIFDTNIIKTDLEPIKKLANEINAIGVNINQIARKANQEESIEEKKIEQLLKNQEELKILILTTIDKIEKKKG